MSARCSACKKANYKENPHRNRERAKAHYWKNRESCLRADAVRRRSDPEKHMWMGARQRARAKGIEFSIHEWEVCVPKFCPVFGIPLEIGQGKPGPNSPTLDRIDPSKGYISGNIIVVSQKANTMKSNATLREMRLLVRFYERLERERRSEEIRPGVTPQFTEDDTIHRPSLADA